MYAINTTCLGYLAQGKNGIESVSDMSRMEMKVVYKALSIGTLRGHGKYDNCHSYMRISKELL